VFFAWFVWAELLAGIAKTATGKACNECKTLVRQVLDCVKMLGHESSFPNRRILDSGRNRITKGPKALMAKPVTAFPQFVM